MNTNITKHGQDGLSQAQPAQISSGMASEQSLAIAKIQAALTIAKHSPRDELGAIAKIVKSCQRKGLAEKANYTFKKGDGHVSGATIQLATVIANHWGNIRFGFREIGGSSDYVEVEAFAWDLENNTEATRLFRVHHIRDTRNGPVKLTSERDRYENMAGAAQRRVRACIQQVVPEDIFETALAECEKTLDRTDPRSLDEKKQWLIVHFQKMGVSKAMIEDRLGHPFKAAVLSQVTALGKIYQNMKNGLTSLEEVFKTPDKEPDRMVPRERHGNTDSGNLTRSPESVEKPNDSARGSGAHTDTDSSTDQGNPGVDRPFNPVEELHGLAEVMWGARAGENLKTACVGNRIELDKITNEQASMMIDVLSGMSGSVGTPREF